MEIAESWNGSQSAAGEMTSCIVCTVYKPQINCYWVFKMIEIEIQIEIFYCSFLIKLIL